MNRMAGRGELPGTTGATSFLAVAVNGSGAEAKNFPLPAVDEVPEPGWPTALLHVRVESATDAAFGTVLPRFEVAPGARSASRVVFAKGRYRTDAIVGWEAAYTAIVLFSQKLVQLVGSRFELRIAAVGAPLVAHPTFALRTFVRWRLPSAFFKPNWLF